MSNTPQNQPQEIPTMSTATPSSQGLSNFKIPDRTSSKRPLEVDADLVMQDVKKLRKGLNPQSSFSTEYWTDASRISGKLAERERLHRKLSQQIFLETKPESEAASWENTAEAEELFQRIKAFEAEEKLFQRQALRVKPGGNKSLKRSFIELFTSSTQGLKVKDTGQGRRITTEQSNFRKDIEANYAVKSPDPRKADWVWDPILKKYDLPQNTTAAHLFAYCHGQNTMDAIFGLMDSPELFSPRNGLMLNNVIETKFDSGFLAIVPLLPNNPSKEDMAVWSSSDPKNYKVRILNFKHEQIDHIISPLVEAENMTWRSLDGMPLEFKNDFRPRAPYLYFHFCVQILRLSWSHQRKDAKALKKELGRVFWGTPGRYLPRHMLTAFIDELGHEYEALLEGAMEGELVEDNEDSDILLATATKQITAPKQDKDLDSDDEETEDEDQGESDTNDSSVKST